jgi:glycosyltransferase involved in cell wall biosynthesis
MDLWKSPLLTGTWYSADVERLFVKESHVLVATCEPLKDWLEELGGEDVRIIPNGVDTTIFRYGVNHPRPLDLPRSTFTIVFVGTLTGGWVDWELLRKLTKAYEAANVVLIGDYDGRCSDPPQNLHFMGRRRLTDLPPYIAHSDVGIIPYAGPLVRTVNSLKAYQYVAMGKPVVAPRSLALDGIPYVLFADNHDEFISAVGEAHETRIDPHLVQAFAEDNSWDRRVSELSKLLAAVRTTLPQRCG